MFGARKPNSIVGLDIETGSVAATELRSNGSHEVARVTIAPLEPGVVNDGEVQDVEELAKVLRAVFAKGKLGKDVRIGLANQRVVMRTLRLPLIEDDDELDAAVRFQAQEQIPMPLDQAVLDHEVVAMQNGVESGGERQMDVIAVAARKDMVTELAQAVRKAGLRPAGIDLSAFGMIRALAPDVPPPEPGEIPPETTFYCSLGDITNLAVAQGERCLFTRVSLFGMESIASDFAEREELSLDEARDYLFEVGLERPLDSFTDEPGRAAATREVLEEGVSKLISELRVSLEFYAAQEGATPVSKVVVCGHGSTLPGLTKRIQEGLGLGIESAAPVALAHLDDEDAARLTVSYGLALGV